MAGVVRGRIPCRADEPAHYDRGKTRAPDIAGDESDLREARRKIMELLIGFDR